MAAIATPLRGGSRFGISRAHKARSGRPSCSSRRIPRRQRPGVQLAPSGKITSAPPGLFSLARDGFVTGPAGVPGLSGW